MRGETNRRRGVQMAVQRSMYLKGKLKGRPRLYLTVNNHKLLSERPASFHRKKVLDLSLNRSFTSAGLSAQTVFDSRRLNFNEHRCLRI